MKTYLTVKDILQRKHFESVEIVAGIEGISRIVKWVHVVEVTSIRKLLNGHELILSTGVAWKENKDYFISVVEQLIDAGAAGLCIEIGTYTTNIPQEIITIANEHQFPILVFHQEVPFVEITQDIHGLLINRQYQMISDLESYSQNLNKKLLSIDHYIEILKYIQQYLSVQVMIIFTNKEVQFLPEPSKKDRNTLIGIALNEDVSHRYSIARTPIQVLGDTYAELVILTRNRELTEFDHLILDRTCTALAQFFLRDLYVEEKRRVEETEWMNGWLEGEQSLESIREFLSYQFPSKKTKGVVSCICKFETYEQYSNLDLTFFKLYVRTIFEQQGFSLLSIEKRNTIVFIMLNERTQKTWKHRMQEGIKRLLQSEDQFGKRDSKPMIAIGQFVEELTNLHKSYQTALETIRIQDRLSTQFNHYFYDDLHIFRLISLLNRHLDLHELVKEYLDPVIAYDQKHNGKLMETLKVYLACNGSKKETAEQLFIVRQTLYHRLQKLNQLLGDDFMIHEKRLAIEFMTLSYDYLRESQQTMNLEVY